MCLRNEKAKQLTKLIQYRIDGLKCFVMFVVQRVQPMRIIVTSAEQTYLIQVMQHLRVLAVDKKHLWKETTDAKRVFARRLKNTFILVIRTSLSLIC